MKYLTPIKSVTIAFYVQNLKETIEWYKRIFGDLPETEPVPGIKELELFSGCWLQLIETESHKNNESILRLEVENEY